MIESLKNFMRGFHKETPQVVDQKTPDLETQYTDAMREFYVLRAKLQDEGQLKPEEQALFENFTNKASTLRKQLLEKNKDMDLEHLEHTAAGFDTD